MSSSESGSEEEEDDDVFELDAPLSRSSSVPQDGSGGGAPPGALRGRGQPSFDPSKRRGSVIVLGGKQSSVSVAAEVAATIRRMEAANESNDINQMQAALSAAGSVAAMAGPGDPTTTELQMVAMKLASRLSGDESLRETAVLRRSRTIRDQIRRLWDLMEMESAQALEQDSQHGGAARAEVTREGYRQMHIRISRALCDPNEGFAEEKKALALADKDWAGDISRFSGTSHITVWLAAVREKFHEASARAVGTHGFAALFKRYDADGSGELDEEEFTKAVRSDLGVDEEKLNAKELKQLFNAVDADGSGEVDAEEFTGWLFKSDRSEPKNLRQVKEKFRAASEKTTQGMGWQIIFDRYDDDNSGELDEQEFTNAVRAECGLSEDAVSDDEIKELFGVIDTDQGGGIDSGELMELLEANLDEAAITFGAFYSSIFELATVWAHDEDEEDPEEVESNFVLFLQAVFKATAVPRDHVEHYSAAELETLDVFEDVAKSRPNFKLRPLGTVETLVQADGTINLTGDRPTGKGPKILKNQAEPEPEPEPEPEVETVAAPSVRMNVRIPTVGARSSQGQTVDAVAAKGSGTAGSESGAPHWLGDGQQGYLGGQTRNNVLWSPVAPKVFALHDPMLAQNPRAGSELAPAAARRKGCWVLPWQVRFARRPPGGAGALGAKRGDPASQRATVGKPKVRVTRSKFMEQYNHTEVAHETPYSYRRHGALTQPDHGVSSQEYWAARRAILIETGVRATTSAQLASSKAVQRQQQMAVVKGAARHTNSLPSSRHTRPRDNAAPHSGGRMAEKSSPATVTARQEKERIEKMVSPFSPKGRGGVALEDYDEPPGSEQLLPQRPQTAPEQSTLDADLARPKVALEGIDRIAERHRPESGIARPQTAHMLSSTTYAAQARRTVSTKERAAIATGAGSSSFSAQERSPMPSTARSPHSPAAEKTPRQVQSARDRRARAASAASRTADGLISPGSTARRGLDAMAIARGQTRPTAPAPPPLFLPLSPRKFEGWAGTSLEKKMARKSRPSKAVAALRPARSDSDRAASPSRSVPSPVDNSRVSSPWLEQAANTVLTAAPASPGSKASLTISLPARMPSPTGSPMPCFSPQPPAATGGSPLSNNQLRGSRSSPRSSPLTGADLRCYRPESKFIALAV